MDPIEFTPLEPIVDPRWEHLIQALGEWGATLSQTAHHLAAYNGFGPEDGAVLHDHVLDTLRRFLPDVLESASQDLIDDTALGINLVNQYFSNEVYYLAPGVTLADLLDDEPEQAPRNRAERRRSSRRRRR